jgi:hypothetical protein
MMSRVCTAPPRWTGLAFLVVTAMLLLFDRVAAARATGIVTTDCAGCHGSASESTATLVASPSTFNPGDMVTLTLTIASPTIKVGGAYVTSGGVGTLRPISGEGLAASSGGLTHTSPKAAVGGQVTFRFTWQAPSAPGGIEIDAYVLAGNGNNASSGDAPGSGSFLAAFGCEKTEYFRDWDADGYGARETGMKVGCPGAPPMGYAARDGDCDENSELVFPGAAEICNGKDDNCNGQVDEGAPAVMLWPDADGDGYYATATGTPVLGCAGLKGYAALPGDCAPSDPAIHPGVKEICNGKDDNCDGRVDERVRPQCGVGGCARESSTCDPADCTPGQPRQEDCNFFDDDCDGEIDNNARCDSGLQCSAGACVAMSGMTGAGGSTATGSGGSGAKGSGGSGSTGGSGGAATGGGSGQTGDGSSGGAGGSGGNAPASPGAACGVVGPGGDTWTSLLLILVALGVAQVRRSHRGPRNRPAVPNPGQ